ncbi:hypothetical protein [Agromyces neolithicus]|uniref:Uncharacterized protein n=1 Tax=Agromyces neolithicus TaxID=269420 RepID=A0ABN2LQA9_9MICO
MDRIIIAVVIVGGYLALVFAASPAPEGDGVADEVAASVKAHAMERRLGAAQAEAASIAASVKAHAMERRLGAAQAEIASVAAVTADAAERLLADSALDRLSKLYPPR